MSDCACLQILSSQWFSSAAGTGKGESWWACLARGGGPVNDPGLNCDPGAMMQFHVPCAEGSSDRDVTFMVFVVRSKAQASMAHPPARTRAALAEPADGPLTPHEKRLLKLLMQGHRYRTAAAELGVTSHTVSFHLRRVYQKLDVHSKSEAVIKALREGLI